MRAFKLVIASSTIVFSQPLIAQEGSSSETQEVDYLASLKSCQLLKDDTDRLACFDRAVGSVLAANEAGKVQVVDQNTVEETRRSLFGFTLPKIALFGGDENVSKETKEKRELLETTIKSVSYRSRKSILFTTAEGATWRISNAPSRLRTIKPGQTVVFKKAAIGSFFIRIAGQLGVKGVRIK